MSKNEDRFEIAPEDEVVGTQILDPTLPSNIDFEKAEGAVIEMTEINPNKPKQEEPQLGKIDLENLDIRSYSIKGKVVFSMSPHHKLGSLLPANTPTFPVKCFNQQSSGGFKGLWEAVIGYTSRQILVEEGFIYLLIRQARGLFVSAQWRLVDLFKIFLDYQQSRLRLVLREDGGERLQMKDYESANIRDLVQVLGEKINAIGLSLVG